MGYILGKRPDEFGLVPDKDGYLPLTQTVILTLQKPIRLINFFMYEDLRTDIIRYIKKDCSNTKQLDTR